MGGLQIPHSRKWKHSAEKVMRSWVTKKKSLDNRSLMLSDAEWGNEGYREYIMKT